jgi:hypothetical protein
MKANSFMKKYTWEVEKYNFELFIGAEDTRWNDEGVLQAVKLHINGVPILDNNWGIEHNYGLIMVCTKITDDIHKGNTIEINNEVLGTIVISGDNYKDFINWIKSCLCKREERIKIKLNKIKEKL